MALADGIWAEKLDVRAMIVNEAAEVAHGGGGLTVLVGFEEIATIKSEFLRRLYAMVIVGGSSVGGSSGLVLEQLGPKQ